MPQKTSSLHVTPLTNTVYYIPNSANIGVITEKDTDTTHIWLVDSGDKPEVGPRIKQALDMYFTKYTLEAIICTHSHSDHVSGNAYLAQTTGCKIWITQGEQSTLEYPELEQLLICGGTPFPQIKNPYFSATPSHPDRFLTPNEEIVLPQGTHITCIPMPGHHFDMIALLITTPDNKTLFFAGDAIFGKEHMNKYWIPFMLEIGKQKQTLKRIAKIQAQYYVPSHGEVTQSIDTLTELNKFAIHTIEQSIINLLQTPQTTEHILKKIADEYHITLHLTQVMLIGTTIRSYLVYLYKCGRITFDIIDNELLWKRLS